jgi:2-oxoglutarate ferredoxin oxidoreductase subunit delta
MARARGSVAIDAERCTGCNICVELCPQDCLELGDAVNSHDYRIAILASPDDCTGCEVCGWVCPHWAIDVFREGKAREPASGANTTPTPESATK